MLIIFLFGKVLKLNISVCVCNSLYIKYKYIYIIYCIYKNIFLNDLWKCKVFFIVFYLRLFIKLVKRMFIIIFNGVEN